MIKRTPNMGFMPSGMVSLNDQYNLASRKLWPSSHGVWGMGPNDQAQLLGWQTGAPWNGYGEAPTPRMGMNVFPNASVVSLAVSHSSNYLLAAALAVTSDGKLWGWTSINNAKFMGQGTANTGFPPTQIGTDTDWESVYANGQQAWFALKNGGELWSVGVQSSGRLGNGVNSATVTTTWARVQSSYTFTRVATSSTASSFSHSMFIRSDGTLWALGSNTNGKTGQGTTTGTLTVLTQVGTDTDWKEVACSGNSTSAIKTNGTLWTWGSSLYGVSNGNSTPTQLGTDTDWDSLSGSPQFLMFAIKTDGRAYRSGSSTNIAVAVPPGGAGNGSTSQGSLVAFDSGNALTWAWIKASSSYTIAMTTSGDLYFSGDLPSSPFMPRDGSGSGTVPTNYVGLKKLGSLPPTAIGAIGDMCSMVAY